MRLPILLITALLSAPMALAHEFWLSPQTYQVDPGAPVIADLRLGQNFSGAPMSFLPGRITRFELFQGETVTEITSRIGDRPAMSQPAPAQGLAIIVHETTDQRLTYTEWAKFTDFVTHKAFDGLPDTHTARGLPQTGFDETYRRYAKSLVAIGDGQGQDRAIGLETEIVALRNPYTDDLTGGLPVRVLYQGHPRNNAQLELFNRAPGGQIEIQRLRTDQNGEVSVPVAPGHEYLLDAVILLDTGQNDPALGPVWHSLWASLTFRVPLE
ncbi:DUF4198 domain-containing protein [Actibacterium sp. XHP0104]|uniref:DUF4198 domain-containing protein n=1 Tax=Actibacterium sp. XHP0104 TaxID=2984335 RepID=UPI0021E7E6F2|nr:DUF4198 domain-containing protein [Actibacterium sp. XHP0104]MCV2882026.1 DUF4198 domain-containing protein [Actibacterium sp. XHP0104]